MIDQQLYLDGQLMDLGEDTSITLDIKSNLFRDVTKMTANNTYTVQLPKTVHNMTVLGLSCKPNASTDYPHVFHTARYYRNGLEIFSNGRASILSIEDDIELSIYWGMFPALTEFQSSDLKLNELEISEYLTFNRWNSPDKYDEAMARGFFYADYDTANVKRASEDWINYDITQIPSNVTFIYILMDGKIYTGETVGAHVSGEIVDDDDCRCGIFPFDAGQTVTFSGLKSKGEYRTWAILDSDRNIITMANDEDTESDISMHAPTNSAYIIINATKSLSSGTEIRIMNNNTDNATRAAQTSAATGYFGSNIGRNAKGTIQPSVSCKYILERITSKTGVQFGWSSAAEEIINSLAIPLITRKADANSLDGGVEGDFAKTSKLGKLSFNLSKVAPLIFSEDKETSQQLTLKVDCTLTFDVQMYWSWDASKTKPQGSRSWTNDDGTTSVEYLYTYYPNYIEMKVVSKHTSDQAESEYTKKYIIGKPSDADDVASTIITDTSNDMNDGRFTHFIAGRGTLDLQEGDIVTFEMKNKSTTLRGLSCYNGILSASIKQSDEVPYGGKFPIGKNLPEVTAKDFIKFLCVITGTFPTQDYSGNTLKIASISAALDKATISERAVNWTKKLIPSGVYNQPRQMDYSVEDYCRHNLYKWKEDETVYKKHDADMVIDNATLEYTQDTWTMPFAATDDNRVPIYEWESYDAHYGSGENKTTITQQSATKYKACKDRIMTVYKRDDGCAALRFDIDLQGMFDNELKGFRQMIANSRQITERMLLTDLDIRNFDETKPVYLAQYACYFMVLEIKTTNNGYCEVQMIKIY